MSNDSGFRRMARDGGGCVSPSAGWHRPAPISPTDSSVRGDALWYSPLLRPMRSPSFRAGACLCIVGQSDFSTLMAPYILFEPHL